MLAAALFYYMFFVYDRIIEPGTADTTQIIRAFVAVAICGGVAITALPGGRRYLEVIYLLLGCIGSIALCAIFAMQSNGYYLGVAGYNLLIVGFSTLLFIRLHLFIYFLLFSVVCFFVGQHFFDSASFQIQFADSYFISGGVIIGFATCYHREQSARAEFELEEELAEERAKSERLLYNVLPEPVVARLKQGRSVADSYGDVSVIFVDLVGSSELARQLSPGYLIEVLGLVFSLGDRCAGRHGVEKVKTIGDAYLAVAGATIPADRAAPIRFARDFIAGVAELAAERALPLQLRVGIHTGPVIGGVIGETRLTYDYWGNTMNVAARVEAVAEPGGIAVTEQTYHATKAIQRYREPRQLTLKGIGETSIYDAIMD